MEPQIPFDQEQELVPIPGPPDIQPATTMIIKPPLPPVTPQGQEPDPPYFLREEDDEEDVRSKSNAFVTPFQVSSGMPILDLDRSGTGARPTVPPQRSSRKPRSLLLRIALAAAAAIVVLGVLWITVFAQPAPQQLSTVSGGQTPSPHHLQPTSVVGRGARPTLAPTTKRTDAGAGAGTQPMIGNWVSQQLPVGWMNAGLTAADAVFAERTAWTFTDREEGLDFRNIGTRTRHGGTFTASTFILSPGGKARFAQNDVRVINNTFFDKVVAHQLVQSAVNAVPKVVAFQGQGQNQFAWIDVSYQLFQSQLDLANPQHRIEGLEQDPATQQPRVHHMSVLLIRVQPAIQGANAPMGGSGWLVSNYGLDLTSPLTIVQPA